jgi:hypothetical protein
MDYDQFFPKKEVECDCSDHIRGTAFLITLVVFLIDCIAQCSHNKKMKKLETENETLKSVLFKSVDRALIRMMKNGNDIDNNDEE